ncbi:MAG: AraC family transcriptional regulator [Treponema sp.]|jgi:AraC-like DNA-binding protein|nr:AraC family transcriptional regulator [Treponema sp.]
MRYLVSDNGSSLVHVSSGQLLNRKNFIHQRRNLDTFVIIVCLKGTLYIAQDERRRALSENQFIILFAGHEHYGYRECGGALSYYWCHFKISNGKFRIIEDSELAKLFDTRAGDPGHAENNEKHFSSYYTLPEYGEIPPNGRTILIFRQLLDFARKNCYSDKLPDYALSLLAMEISQEFIETRFHDKNRKLNPKMEKIVEWIRVNYNLHISMQEIAKIFSYNPDYLSTAFRRYTGYPLIKYITMVKISNAKKMLLGTGEGIKEIAYKAGFGDEKTFMKRFKQIENITPTTYRNAFNRVKIVK